MDRTHDTMVALIRESLTKANVSQAEFARRVGVSEKHLSKVLAGLTDARLATLDYWAYSLGFRFMVRANPMSHPQKENK